MHQKHTRSHFLAASFWLGSAAISALASSVALAQQAPLTKEEEAKRKAQQQQQQQQQQKAPPPAQKTPPPVQAQPKPTPPPVQKPVVVAPPPKVVAPPPPPPKVMAPPPPPKTVTTPPPVQAKPLVPPPPPPKATIGTPPPVPPKAVVTPPPKTTPPPPQANIPPPSRPLPPTNLPPPGGQGPGAAAKGAIPGGTTTTPPPGQKPAAGSPPPGVIAPGNPPPKVLAPVVAPPGTPPGAPPTVIGAARVAAPGAPPPIVQAPPGPAKIDDVRKARVEKTDARGRKVIEEPGNRTIIKQDNRVFITRNETKTIQHFYPNARSTPLPGGIVQTVYVRPDGTRIFSETDGSGRLIRRFGRPSSGPEITYIDNRKFYRNLAIGAVAVGVGVGIALALAPPAHAVPRHKYIVEYDRATDDDLYETFTAPPVIRLERAYSLEEIRYSQPLRERMRRVDLDGITFETGSAVVDPGQYGKLDRIARAIGRAIEANPAEMFLIEGHTDAVGAPEDNLSLSDRRAEAVARVLTEHYSIPMENLVTQGYGEQHLKVETRDAERTNRRVTMRRVGPLLSGQGG